MRFSGWVIIPCSIKFPRCTLLFAEKCFDGLSFEFYTSKYLFDTFIWGLHQNGKIFINSMYQALIADTRVMYIMTFWRLKIPLRIKIFMW
jgi:hypothetical protein